MKNFTEDEKIIARNIDKKYKWIARDSNGNLYVYGEKPEKIDQYWDIPIANGLYNLIAFNHMFSSIKWADDEPTRISDIYNPQANTQVLDNVERAYLKMILKPFHEKVGDVVKHRDISEDIYSKEYLYIAIGDGDFTFPSFDSGKMYAGMELDKEYTLDELGITYENEKQELAKLLGLDDLPSVTPKGKWVKVKNGRGGHECNICHTYAPSYQNGDEYLSRFCPNCGAKMDERESE